MRRIRLAHSGIVLATALTSSCGEPSVDDTRPDRRLIAPAGIVTGAVTYQGARPCSRDGHIVGGAIVLVFDRRNPPPPKGLANTAVNFALVPGDRLFVNETPNAGPELYCPADHGFTDSIIATADFTVSPLYPASYMIQAFYDSTGNFFPLLKVRNLPELGDVGGGHVDTADAAKHVGDATYQPIYLPVDVGIPDPNAAQGTIPNFTIPPEGFVRANVAVTIGAPLTLTRPYFYATNPHDPGNQSAVGPDGNPIAYWGGYSLPGLQSGSDLTDTQDSSARPGTARHPGSTETDPNWMPIITMTQDHRVYARPKTPTSEYVDAFQASFKQLVMKWGVAPQEVSYATDPIRPFHFQIDPNTPRKSGFFLWGDYPDATSGPRTIPEGVIPRIFPLVVLAKLADDSPGAAPHSSNPQQLIAQGDDERPVVILQGITLLQDSVMNTVLGGLPPKQPAQPADHFTALIRPTVICVGADPASIAQGGLLVVPHVSGPSPDDPMGTHDIITPDAITAAKATGLVRDFQQGCLPKGRYGINIVYPDGQAWTLPNEAGACGGSEGTTVYDPNDPTNPGTTTCTIKNANRPVLYSQGTRAVLEIVDAADPSHCVRYPVPTACCPKGFTVVGGACVPPIQSP